MIRLALLALVLLLAVLGGVIGIRTANFTAAAPPANVTVPDVAAYAIDANAAAQHLSAAVRFRTVSLAGAATDDRAQFARFHAWLEQTYPAFHAVARREMIGELSLMYTWVGSDPGQPPMLLLAHQDVVPVPPDTVSNWRYDPFAGVIADGAVWGRGSIDDKSSLIALLEAAESLAREGKRPKRTIIFAFGHDEEIGGDHGAAAMAAQLERQGVHAWFALDEGLAVIAEHPLTGHPAALIGISEKGSGTLRVVAHGQAGHSSMPPPETAISTLAEAVTRIHGMPIERSLEGGPALDMMRALAPEIPLTTRAALANEWIAAPLLRQRLAGNPAAQALLGTTVAPTVIVGGSRPNVLPGEATAMINLRIHPRDHADDLLARARKAVEGMEGVSVDWAEAPREASPVSHASGPSYALIAALAHGVSNAPVAPGLVIAGTDSRLYGHVAEDVYRFQPIVLTNEDLETIHGVNEHLSIDNLVRVIRFYRGLMEAGAM